MRTYIIATEDADDLATAVQLHEESFVQVLAKRVSGRGILLKLPAEWNGEQVMIGLK